MIWKEDLNPNDLNTLNIEKKNDNFLLIIDLFKIMNKKTDYFVDFTLLNDKPLENQVIITPTSSYIKLEVFHFIYFNFKKNNKE